MTTRSRPRRQGGFTLLELVVVLALLAITAAAAVPAFLSDAGGTPARRTATALAAALMRARDRARESGSPTTFVLSPSDGRFWLTAQDSTEAGVVQLPATVTLVAGTSDRVECRFEPTGAATPMTISVQGARRVTVRVDGWSGEIGIGDEHRS